MILDATSGEVLRELEPIPRPDDATYFTNTVAVAFMSDDRLIVTSQAGTIRIVDPHTGAELQRFEGPRETAEGVAILAPDESWLLTSGARGLMRYDLPSGAPAWGAPSDHVCESSTSAVAPIGLAVVRRSRRAGHDHRPCYRRARPRQVRGDDRCGRQRGNPRWLDRDRFRGPALLALAYRRLRTGEPGARPLRHPVHRRVHERRIAVAARHGG